MAPVIDARGLTKRYGARVALRDVSFEVEAGQVLGLLGPNGSGKSTILRILTGYLCPTSGCARVAGFDVSTHSIEVRRRIGYVPEDAPLYSNMIVEEFLHFMGTIRGLQRGRLRSAVDDAGARLALDAVWGLHIAKLSRGYRQRVAIAQALLGRPELLVLDEPTNGLDPRQIMEMRGLIRELSLSHTLIVTSHILSEIEQVATHAAILLEGRLLTVQPLRTRTGLHGVRAILASGAPEDVVAVARAIPRVRSAAASSLPGGSVELRVSFEMCGAEATLSSALVASGYALTGMCPDDGGLESLFLKLTSAQVERSSELA